MKRRIEALGRRSGMLTIAAASLAVAIFVVGWLGYVALSKHGRVLSQFTGFKRDVATLGGRLKDAEAKLERWAGDGQQMQARIDAVSRQAVESAAEMTGRLEARLDQRIDHRMRGMEARIADLESANDSRQQRVAELQQELGQARREIAQQATAIDAVRYRPNDSGMTEQRLMASLRISEERNQRELSTLAAQIAVRRVDFAVTKNQARELAPGISMKIIATDVAYRRVDGWMWVMPDRRAVWLRRHDTQQPVIFYGYADGKKREMVITDVTRNSVTGYLLLPAIIHNAAQ